jgi:hypothetical protein
METAVARTSTKGKRKSKRQIKQEQTNTNKQNHENVNQLRIFNRNFGIFIFVDLNCTKIV